MRKICIFTSTRADWGQLSGLATELASASEVCLQLLVSGSHLSKKFGMTVCEIEDAGFQVDECVDILQFDDTPVGICKTMGVALSGYGEALERLNPDILIILGDRYESFCAAATAQTLRIPLAHIHGGETTEGAIDEAFRHSITKMAQIHFPSCDEYRNRIIQLGENPERVFNVGALAIENIRKLDLVEREQLSNDIGFDLNNPFFLVTFHPVTLENSTAGQQFDELVAALERFPEHGVIFTKANADSDGQVINSRIDELICDAGGKALGVHSLGLLRYLSAMRFADAVVGNSSSGLLEAPVFRVPTVNIGDRQKGRIRVASVLNCEPERNAIIRALEMAMDNDFRKSLQKMEHPCEKAETAKAITCILATINLNGLLKKTFHNLPYE
jgi:GDP/UDP-N,N'-diacetylbacillosamine 2-epimerase (hydrolysing)